MSCSYVNQAVAIFEDTLICRGSDADFDVVGSEKR